jgi:hypothetical protein
MLLSLSSLLLSTSEMLGVAVVVTTIIVVVVVVGVVGEARGVQNVRCPDTESINPWSRTSVDFRATSTSLNFLDSASLSIFVVVV